MRISGHFKEEEFACKCCGKVIINEELVDLLEDVRNHFGKPVHISSGYRCKVHNAEVGGKSASQHLTGKACDITIVGVKPSEIADYLDNEHPSRYGIGDYKTFTHVDVRTTKARWTA